MSLGFYPVVGGPRDRCNFLPPDSPKPKQPVFLDLSDVTQYVWDAEGERIVFTKKKYYRSKRHEPARQE